VRKIRLIIALVRLAFLALAAKRANLTAQAIYNAQAHVRDFSLHDLRRTFVSNQLEAGADIATIAWLAVNASAITTVRLPVRSSWIRAAPIFDLVIYFRLVLELADRPGGGPCGASREGRHKLARSQDAC
jgi:hypothetical protein